MTAPSPIRLYHFTHISHLRSVMRDGLRCDTQVRASGSLLREAGDPGIKDRRRTVVVAKGPGGVVADYVPFYFGFRSPMLYKIWRGSVTTYTGTQHDLVYLCTTEAVLRQNGVSLVASDRNAAAAYVAFSDDRTEWDGLIDWSLMSATMWRDTPEEPDRMQRRMAECLAHQLVPWSAIVAIGVATPAMAEEVRAVLAEADDSTKVVVRPDWYY